MPCTAKANLNSTAASLLLGQASFHGVAPENNEIAAAELNCGRDLDPRVSQTQYAAISRLYDDAQNRFFAELETRRELGGLNVLLGPTARVVDHMLDAQGVSYLLQYIDKTGKSQELLNAIDRGPPNGELVWDSPTTPIELVASMIRWTAIRDGDKKRIRTNESLRGWINTALSEFNYDTKPRLGGVTAVGTALTRVLGHSPSMIALGKLPPKLKELLAQDIKVVGSNPKASKIGDLELDPLSAGNHAISFNHGAISPPKRLENFTINGVSHTFNEILRMDILVTGSSSIHGFNGIGIDRMRELGDSHQLKILSGLQSLNTDTEIKDYLDHVQVAHDRGMPVGLLYSESRFPVREAIVWGEVKKRHCLEFIGLNSGEAYDLVKRLYDSISNGNPLNISDKQAIKIEAALNIGGDYDTPWENGRESPEWIFQSAVILQEILDIPVVRMRGKAIDLLVADKVVNYCNFSGVREHLIISRNMGTVKVANPSGILDEPQEIVRIENMPHGHYLAALHKVADIVSAHNTNTLGTSSNSGPSCELATTCLAKLVDGTHVVAIPPVPFFNRSGGTQSAGDTIDVTFVTEEASGLMRAAFVANMHKKDNSNN